MESSIIILLVRCQVYVVILAFLLVLFAIHIVSRTLLIVLVIIVLLVEAIRCLSRWMVIYVILFRRMVNILFFVVIHIS